MSSIRERALKESHKHEAARYFVDERPVSSYFGQNVLDIELELADEGVVAPVRKIDLTLVGEGGHGAHSAISCSAPSPL